MTMTVTAVRPRASTVSEACKLIALRVCGVAPVWVVRLRCACTDGLSACATCLDECERDVNKCGVRCGTCRQTYSDFDSAFEVVKL